jgi:hypothetical protein
VLYLWRRQHSDDHLQDTAIEYQGVILDMAAVHAGKNSECRVPHLVWRANGVAITTSCGATPLRLTADHLVFTARGLLRADNVKVSDMLFSDEAQQKPCTVTQVSPEHSAQRYFGLNCRHSTVIAAGIKTSTFGSLHTLPSLWMRTVSFFAGPHRASIWGDYISSFWSASK